MTLPVIFERRGAVALLTLNRPEKLNALSYALNDLLQRFIEDIETDDTLRAVILTGAGDRVFSAGSRHLGILAQHGEGRGRRAA